MNNRFFCIGDIHGRYKALEQVFERAGFNYENDTCIFVGDIVDRGEQSFECIEFMYGLKNKILIKGNHDENFHQYIKTKRDVFHGKHGSFITTKLWNAEKNEERKKLIEEYFTLTIPYYIDGKNRMFTHGGFDNMQRVEDQDDWTFSWDRELWNQAIRCAENQKVPTVDCFNEIYIGHTPTINYSAKEEVTMSGIILAIGEPITTPMHMGGVWNLDTGAGFPYGKLSMMNIDTKEIFQSDIMSKFYEY